MFPSLVSTGLADSTENNIEEDESVKLTLAYENLYEVPRTIVERFSNHIQYLDISHNKITNLDALVHFKHLSSLIADDNPINENCFLPPLPKLQLLWLNRCKIASIYPWVGKLKESCPNIKYLSLMGNPAAPSYFNGGTFYEYLQYRLFVIAQFPSLSHLDDRKLTEDQRLEAQRLYKRPLMDRWTSRRLDKEALLEASIVKAWQSQPSPVRVDEEVEWLGQLLTQVCDTSMAQDKPPPSRDQPYWWSDEIAALRVECVAARRAYTRHRRRRQRDEVKERELYEVYREKKKTLQLAISRAKTQAREELWTTICVRDKSSH